MVARSDSQNEERLIRLRATQRFNETRLSSYGLTVLGVVTAAQFASSPFGFGLSERAFVAVVTATAFMVCVTTVASMWFARRDNP